MERSITCIENLDLEISVAYLTLGVVREVWTRCPVAENQVHVDEAEAEVNRLLDRRFAVQRGEWDALTPPLADSEPAA